MSDEEIKNQIRQVFLNPSVAEQVADYVVRDKPPGWGRRSVAPYYKERFGNEVKDAFDGIEEDKQDRIWPLNKFSINIDSLYLRVNQGLHYLLDRLDTPDKKYYKLNEMVSFVKEKGLGIRMSLLPDYAGGAVDFTPIAVKPKSEAPQWKQEIDDYLEDDRMTKPLHITSLALTPDEIKDLKNSFAQLKTVMAKVTAQEIKVVKVRA